MVTETYRVYKKLVLWTEVEAENPREAVDKMLNMDDNDMELSECDYEVYTEDDEFVDPEEYE